MDDKELIEEITMKGYPYVIENGIITISSNRDIEIHSHKLPEGVIFEGSKSVFLFNLKSIPPNTQFINRGSVIAHGVESVGEKVLFGNGGNVTLSSSKLISKGVIFKNEGFVLLDTGIEGLSKGVRFENDYTGVYLKGRTNLTRIEEISDQKIMNCLIEQIYG